PGCRQPLQVPEAAAVLAVPAAEAPAGNASPVAPPSPLSRLKAFVQRQSPLRRVLACSGLAACMLFVCTCTPLLGWMLWPRAGGVAGLGGVGSLSGRTGSENTASRGLDAAPTVDVRATGETLVVTEQPRLMVDAEGHTAHIRRLTFTRDGRYVITASHDKTVR